MTSRRALAYGLDIARLHFNLHECGESYLDEEGCDVTDLGAARALALAAARGIMQAEIASGKLCLGCHIEVTDPAGRCVLTLRFKDAVSITGP